ncbi:MAG TPA: ABC transporter ATP-binding protein, partial [Longimicrobiales bacterium]|nr:ABC transporter ATP-binding protein [Longimicrobiales bacterium]
MSAAPTDLAAAGPEPARPAAVAAPAERPTALVSVRGLSYRYRAAGGGGRAALEDVTLELRPGEMVGLLGPNGAGKSTLLRLAAGLLRPTAGSMETLGVPAGRAPRSVRRRIGFAGHDTPHFEELTGRENTVFLARLHGLDPATAAERADALLERVGLKSAADRPVSIYSHGMRRKLVVAEALAHDPRLILLDEPGGGLDPGSREGLYRLLRERCASGAGVLYSTHDTEDAAEWCDRVLLLHGGRLVLEGPPRALIAELGARTRIEATFEAERAPLVEIDGTEVEEATRERLVVRAAATPGVALLEVCARLQSQGCVIRDVHVREPGLRDV